MKPLKNIMCLLITILLLNSCGVTYPKEDLISGLEKLVKKECNQDSKASIVGKTLYLDMQLDGLTSKDRETVLQAMHKVFVAAFATVRVILSSDSDIKYMVTTTYDPSKNTVFRIVRSIDDVKSSYYGRISHSDFESRNLLEIVGPSVAATTIDDRHDITEGEYVGRLLVSQMNMMSRTNPMFGALISMLQLQYVGIDSRTLILLVAEAAVINARVVPTIKNILHDELQTYSKKYNDPFDEIKVITFKGETVMRVSL
ncbi:MAG: hypothetical protein LE180_03080 [Endomicrobium sp.]|uniref:hypothetical protein n=1 Tax=Candidatus Endomicrobiellum pyrsonymphae TaxID=1408203 RepID=UPI0035762307|nr:hypothetical protein [Endomicrobium sp.]